MIFGTRKGHARMIARMIVRWTRLVGEMEGRRGREVEVGGGGGAETSTWILCWEHSTANLLKRHGSEILFGWRLASVCGRAPHGKWPNDEFVNKHFSETGEETSDKQMGTKRGHRTPDTTVEHRELRCVEHLSKHERVTTQNLSEWRHRNFG